MTDAWSSIELDGFERIEAAAGMSLLRVSARALTGGALSATATLAIDDGETLHRFAPFAVPSAAAGKPLSYSVPSALVDASRAFSLEFDDGSLLSLPAPTVISDGPEAPHQAIDELARELQELRTGAELRLAHATAGQGQTLARLAELELELQAGQAIEAELHARLAQSTGTAEQVEALTAERNQLKGELGQSLETLTKLEGRLAKMVTELSIAATARIDAEQAVAQLQAEVVRAQQDRRDAEDRAEQEQVRARALEERATALAAETASAREAGAAEIERIGLAKAELEQTQRQLIGLEDERAQLERRIKEVKDQLAQAAAGRIEAELSGSELQSEVKLARTAVDEARERAAEQGARADELASRIPGLERQQSDTSERLVAAETALADAQARGATLATELEQARHRAQELEEEAEDASRRVAEIEAHLGRSSVRLATLVSERHEAERQRRQLATELADARHALEFALAGAHPAPAPDRLAETAAKPPLDAHAMRPAPVEQSPDTADPGPPPR
ncbi:MAG: hypothetical protein ABSG43_18960 [Solirubrobacteraceae bacterium]